MTDPLAQRPRIDAMDDQQAIERYRYMLRTAPPDDVERAHAESFARLTPAQRRMVLDELAQQVPPSEVPETEDAQSLARLATRAEMRQPGTLERTFSGMPGGPAMGGMFLSTLAGAFVGTAIAGALFADETPFAGDQGVGGEGNHGDAESDFGGGDVGDGGFGGGDFGGGGDF